MITAFPGLFLILKYLSIYGLLRQPEQRILKKTGEVDIPRFSVGIQPCGNRDVFADSLVLSKAAKYMTTQKADIYYGDIIEVSKEKKSLRIYTERNSKIWYYSLGACLCHQGMFCKKELFQSKLFDLDYIVCADREWQMWHIKNGAATRAMKFPIAEVLTDGFSGNHIEDLERETELCVRAYCGKWLVVYKTIKLIKKNKLLHKMIQKTEEMISCKE